MRLSVGAARSAGTDLRWLLLEFPLLCQDGIITQKERQYVEDCFDLAGLFVSSASSFRSASSPVKSAKF